MKYLLALLIPFTLFSQTYNVNVKQNKSFGDSYTDGMKAGAAARSARAASSAAQSAAFANNSTTISTDLLLNNDGFYRAIVLNNVSGWKISDNKSSIEDLLDASQKYYFYKSKKEIPISLQNSDKLLFLDWIREAPTSNDRISTIMLKNISGEIVYEATHRNKSFSEILAPLITAYSMSDNEIETQVKVLRSDAIIRIKELKELLDMGIITQDEFDSEAVELKKIILSK
jgi:hypothetical protein|tara:strand:+ start:123 stop:809 length:687 start_codon:yes stop_codon:yes gene_type:complete